MCVCKTKVTITISEYLRYLLRCEDDIPGMRLIKEIPPEQIKCYLYFFLLFFKLNVYVIQYIALHFRFVNFRTRRVV